MLLRLLIAAPVLLLLVLFALSNTGSQQLHLWPTDLVLVLPLSVAILTAMAIGFFVGGLIVWFTLIGTRLRARRAESVLHAVERRERELEAKVRQLESRLASAAMARTTPAPSHAGTLALTR